MEITHNVPRLLSPPRPPPPASRDTVQLRHKSSRLILPPRPELEDSQVVEKNSRHLNIQLKDQSTTPTTESSEAFSSRPDYMHYHQQARLILSPAVNPRLARNNIDGLYPDSPTLALTPVQTRSAHNNLNTGQRRPDSPTSTYSNTESTEHDSSKEEQATYQTAKQVYISSPTSAHTAALPREFHKSTSYLYPDIPSAPQTPPVPKQVHLSASYLCAGDGSGTPTHSTRAPEEKRNKLRKPPTILQKDIRKTMHMSTPATPSQHVRKTTSMQDLRPSTVTFESTPAPLEMLSSAKYKSPSSWRQDRRGARPRTVAFKSTTTVPTVTFKPTINNPPTVAHASKAPQKGVNLHLRPRTVAFEPTTRSASTVLLHASRPNTTDPPRPKSLGPGPRLIIPSHDNLIQEVPKLGTAVVNRSPTKYQYPTSPRLTRRSTSNLHNTGTLPRSRPFPYRSSSLNPKSHMIDTSDNNLASRNGNTNLSNNLNQSPTSPINAATADSKDIQDIRSTKYLSSEFAATYGTRRQAQRAMTASPTIMARSVHSTLDRSPRVETGTNSPHTIKPPPSRQQISTSPRVTSEAEPAIKEFEPETETGAGTADAADKPTTPKTPDTYGTAIVTSTISYSSSQRRGQHHSIQPPHRLMAPLSRGTNVSPRMGMGSGWI